MNYPPNLKCIWTIEGDQDQFVQFDLFYLHLENTYDVLKVYDGPCTCKDDSNLVEEFTGTVYNDIYVCSATHVALLHYHL